MVITKLTFVILEFSCIFTKKSVLFHERIALQLFHTVIAANSELSAFLIFFFWLIPCLGESMPVCGNMLNEDLHDLG